jgi:hypothetical protein
MNLCSLLRWPTLICAVLCWNLVVGHAADPIKMEVSSPLAVTDQPLMIQAKFRRWFPVAVTLSNTGEPVQGTLILKLSSSADDQNATSTFVTEVDLPTVARKRVWLYGRVERGESDQATLSFSGRGINSKAVKFPLRSPDEAARTVLTISDSEEKLSYLTGIDNQRLGLVERLDQDAGNIPTSAQRSATRNGINPNQARRWVTALGKSHEWIPERPIGLDGVDAVVLQDFPHTALTPAQLTTLRGYVASGGALIVLGGSQWQRLSSSPLADMWPVTPTASTLASSAEVAELVRNYVTIANPDAGDRLGGAPVILTRGTLKSDAALEAGTKAAPLMVLSRMGAGQVLFLAFDPTQPPFLGWSGLGEMWATAFSKTQQPGRIESIDARLEMPGYSPNDGNNYYRYAFQDQQNANEATTGLWQQMASSPQLRTPPVSYIAWFLALYVFCLVPVNYCFLRYFDRRELAWVTVPVIVVAFSVLSYVAALRIKGSIVRTRHVNIVQSTLGSGVARSDAMLWLFSPRKSTYEISGSDPQTVAATYLDGTRDNSNDESTIWQPGEQKPFAVRDTLINMWDYKTFVGQGVASIGQGIRVSSTGGSVQLANNTPYDLRGVVLVNNGRTLSYGDLKAGQTASSPKSEENGSIDPSLRGAIERGANFRQLFPADEAYAYQKMAQSALSLALGSGFGKSNSGVVLVAWGSKPVTRLAATGEDPTSQDVTLWVLRTPEGLDLPSSVASAVEANVRLVSIESQIGKQTNQTAPPELRTYEGDFPDSSSEAGLTISMQGGWNNTYYPYGSYNNSSTNTSPLTRVEVWNRQRQSWQRVLGRLSSRRNVGNWNWQATLDAKTLTQALRQPDNVVRVRVHLSNSNHKITTLRMRRSG